MQEENKNVRTFMEGAIILLIANALVKVIGAVFKIPLTYVLGEEGMGYFSSAYQMYTWMFILATAGIPVAISRMVSESLAKKRYYEISRILSISKRLLLAIGIFGFLLLFFGADFFAGVVLKNAKAAAGIRAIAPAMLFVSLMSAYRGYFQGHQDMVPTAYSEVTEALGKLVIGFGAAFLLAKKGMEIASAGAVFGVSCGAFFGFLILAIIYASKQKKAGYALNNREETDSDKSILKKLVRIAIPITFGASVFSLTSLIDMAMIMRRLQSGGFSYETANKLWGSYSGYAFPMFNLPPTLINAITISIVPAISAAFAVNNHKEAENTTCKSIKVTVLFALPCSVGMSVLAKQILDVVYNNTNATGTLSILSCAIVLVSLVLVTNAILQATGNELVPVINMIIGGSAKILINYFLVANPNIGIQGAPIGTTMCYAIILLLNIIVLKRKLNIKFPVPELVLKPLTAAALMGISVYFVRGFFDNINKYAALGIPIVVGAFVYILAIVLMNGINEGDLELLPKSDKLIPLCKKLKIIK